jgi:putative ABC transport system ATP-binding protein
MSLTLRNLVKRFVAPDGTVVPVVDVSEFTLADGEQAALVGASGSGKTTLLHLIAGILAPDSGQVVLDGTDVAALSEAQRDVFRGRHIGYVFQTHHLLAGFSAFENVLLGMSFTGRAVDRAWARHLLESVGLSDRADYKPAKLSVGQQQRVAVARALANRPKLVLADEPTGALDEKNASQVLALIRDLCRQSSASLLLVTHDRSIAGQLTRVFDLRELNQTFIAS